MKNYQSQTFNGIAGPRNRAALDPMQLTASFVDYEVVEETGRPRYVLYHVRLQLGKLINYQIHRRFSDFERLHAALRQQKNGLQLPKLPEKLLFNNFEAATLRQRMEKLETYLNELLYDFDFSAPDPTFRAFIELKASEIMKIDDVNQSNYPIKTDADSFYVKLIYEQYSFSAELEELRAALVASPPSLQTVRLIFNGKDSLASIFQFAFGARNRDLKSRSFGVKSPQAASSLLLSSDHLPPKKLSFNGKVSSGLEVAVHRRSRRDLLASDKTQRDNHLKCATVTSWILAMLDYSRNPFCGLFRTVLCELNLENFEQTNIKRHLSAPEFTQCKLNIYQLLKIYKDVSKSSRQNKECLLFPENKEYHHFLSWYHAQTHPALLSPVLDSSDRAFLKLSDLVIQGKIRRDLLIRSMNTFAERHNPGFIFFDESAKMTNLCFHLRAECRKEFLSALFRFSWNPNVLSIARGAVLDEVLAGESANAKLGVVWVHPDLPHKVFQSIADLHKLEVARRQIFVFCTAEWSSELHESMQQEFLASEAPLEIRARQLDPQNLDIGLIVDTDERGPEGRLVVSLVLIDSFLDRRNEQLMWFYQYLSRRFKLLLPFVRNKGWLFGDQFN